MRTADLPLGKSFDGHCEIRARFQITPPHAPAARPGAADERAGRLGPASDPRWAGLIRPGGIIFGRQFFCDEV